MQLSWNERAKTKMRLKIIFKPLRIMHFHPFYSISLLRCKSKIRLLVNNNHIICVPDGLKSRFATKRTKHNEKKNRNYLIKFIAPKIVFVLEKNSSILQLYIPHFIFHFFHFEHRKNLCTQRKMSLILIPALHSI